MLLPTILPPVSTPTPAGAKFTPALASLPTLRPPASMARVSLRDATTRMAIMLLSARLTPTAPWMLRIHTLVSDPAVDVSLVITNRFSVTWDPDYFNKTKSSDNSTLMVTARLDLYNRTSESWVKYKEFTDSAVPAAWGYWPFDVKQDYMKYSPYNISITLYSNSNNSLEKTKSSSLYLNLNDQNFPEKSHEKLPEGQTLTIALPVVFGSLFLLIVGGFLWNRKTRRIGLGNISSRSRHGYTGRAKRRIFGARDNGIQLDTSVPPPGEYRDAPQRARADSDGLGSLAGSPVDATFPQQGTTGGRNAFRDEVRRQEE